MSTQARQSTSPHVVARAEALAPPGDHARTRSFRRSFFTLQGLFLLLVIVAGIPEPPALYGAASADRELSLVIVLWLIVDVLVLTVTGLRHWTSRSR